MDIFLDNFYFIFLNSYLALVAVLFGWLMSKADSIFAKAWTGFLWFIFLPNTFYILLDLSHLIEQWPRVSNLFRLILTAQYALFSLFGIAAFGIAVYFFQKLLEGKSHKGRKRMKSSTFIAICMLNLLVGFGAILGGVQRTNSWHIFTDPLRVARDVLAVISSPELLILSFGTGVLANLIYFSILKIITAWEEKRFKQ